MSDIDTGCIDAILSDGDGGCHCFYDDTKSFARTELAALRAQAAEAETLRAERDELKAKANVSICAWCGQECEKESGAIAEHVIVCEKRPEHAMLAKFEELLHTVAAQAAIIKEQQQDIAYITAREAAVVENHRKANAEQARQLDVVRDGIAALISYRNKNLLNFQLEKADDYINALRLWLAANAPAQTEAEEGTR